MENILISYLIFTIIINGNKIKGKKNRIQGGKNPACLK